MISHRRRVSSVSSRTNARRSGRRRSLISLERCTPNLLRRSAASMGVLAKTLRPSSILATMGSASALISVSALHTEPRSSASSSPNRISHSRGIDCFAEAPKRPNLSTAAMRTQRSPSSRSASGHVPPPPDQPVVPPDLDSRLAACSYHYFAGLWDVVPRWWCLAAICTYLLLTYTFPTLTATSGRPELVGVDVLIRTC